VEEFISNVEKLLGYLDHIEEGDTAYVELAKKVARQCGLGEELVSKVSQTGLKKNLQDWLERIRSGEDMEVYVELVRELAKQLPVEEEQVREAMREGELTELSQYIQLIRGGNIHFIEKAREIARRHGLRSLALEEAEREGELYYLLQKLRQLKSDPEFRLLTVDEEKTLRRLARKYGYEAELEKAIEEWKRRMG